MKRQSMIQMEIYVYDISNMRLLHVIETTPNPEAICALSPSADSPYLAYPSPVPSSMNFATAANSSPSTAMASSSIPVWRRPPLLHSYFDGRPRYTST
ncbi:hypothetical protein BYT27DRAFT_6831726 [Phlegmacium glaucopus]|nr:hypothetical protein BYT27DRAFT_6831726 [Phlegmacium glaucopus]